MTDNSDANVSKAREYPYITAKEIASDLNSLPVDISEVEFVHAEEFDKLLNHANELERSFSDYVSCACSVHERLSGHRTDCGSLYMEETLENFRKFKREAGLD